MKQQIIVSGIGGQGVLLLTRVIAQTAVNRGLQVLTAETHGMAQRGGTVLSTIKVDVGLLLWAANLPVHQTLLKESGTLLINTAETGVGACLDASRIARGLGNAVLANLVLLGLAVHCEALFCTAAECETAIRQLVPQKFLAQNLEAFRLGQAGEQKPSP